jgi:ACDE family multidrug resistance protein
MTPAGSSGLGASGVRRAGPPPFGLVLTVTLTGIMGHVLIIPALPDVAADLGVAKDRVGLLLSATTGPGIVLAPVIGVLADRFGRRRVLVPCLALFGVSGGLAAFAPTFEALVGLRALQGIGSAGLINLAVVIIGDHWEGVERARRIGRNAATLTASLVVLPPVGGLIAEVGGWRATFVPYWIALATAAAVMRWLPPSPPGAGTLRGQLAVAGPALRSWSVLGPMILGGAVFLLIFLLLTVVPVYLDEQFGLSAGGRGVVLALPAATSTLGALSIGRLTARTGTRTVVATGLALVAIGFAVVAAVPALGAVAAGLLVYGGGEGLLVATLQDAVAGQAPPESRGAVVATWVGFARAGQTAGPVLAGAGLAAGARWTFAAASVAAAGLAAGHRLLLGGVRARSLADGDGCA